MAHRLRRLRHATAAVHHRSAAEALCIRHSRVWIRARFIGNQELQKPGQCEITRSTGTDERAAAPSAVRKLIPKVFNTLIEGQALVSYGSRPGLRNPKPSSSSAIALRGCVSGINLDSRWFWATFDI